MKHLNMYDKSDWPRILGLTASVLNNKGKFGTIRTKLKKLESIMAARVATMDIDAWYIFKKLYPHL